MMLKYEEGDELSAYSDDEILEPSKRKNIMGILATITKVLAGSLFIKTTLASNISINSSGVVQFGQGQTATTACSGANTLTVTPASSFVNASNGGSQFFKSVTVTGNPTYVYDQYLVTATSAGYDLKYNNTLPSANNDRARPIREF